MIPLAPTRQPATMSTLLLMTKPAADAAKPESELSSEITTGMSPPPIGITAAKPSSSESRTAASIAAKPSWKSPETVRTAAAASVRAARAALSAFCPAKVFALPDILPESLPHA